MKGEKNMPGRKRKYLPYGLTKKEKKNPKIRRKLMRCIKKVEKSSCPMKAKKKDGSYDYKKCLVNPVAVCRASIKKKNKK